MSGILPIEGAVTDPEVEQRSLADYDRALGIGDGTDPEPGSVTAAQDEVA